MIPTLRRWLAGSCLLASLTLAALPARGGNSIYNSSVLADTPIALWSFDETTGTVAADTSGTPQNGNYSNCTLGQASAFTNLGTCAQFNGSSSRVVMPYVAAFDLGAGDFTVELWFKTTVDARGDMFNFKNAVDFGMFANASGVGSVNGYHNGFLPGPTSGVARNAWHHQVYSRSAGTITMYLDGVATGSAADTVSMSATTDIIVGANQTSAWFTGFIDEVAYYNTALSADRVTAHYAAAQQTNANSPVVATGAASAITATGATVAGTVTQAGTPSPTVTVYYGTTNGGITPASWTSNVSLGTQTGAFSTPLTGLLPATQYYYIARAVNTNGESWGSPAQTFTTANVPATVVNVAATSILASSATIGAQVTNTGGAIPSVTLYYGPSDGGTTAGSWAQSVALGPQSGTATAGITGLTPGTPYFFRAFSSNTAGPSWAASSATFTTNTATLPAVTTGAATDITGWSASLGANVTALGNDPPTVKIYYGPTDGGTTAAAWAGNVTATGPRTGAVAQAVGGLTTGTTYFFRAFAQNAAGSVWAASSSSFTTSAAFTPAGVVINEIHYAPVEKEAFNPDGTPFLDLSDDVHEFIELYNAGATGVNLSGWKFSSGVDFTFPSVTLPAGGYVVIAKNPARLSTVYAGLTGVLGPYTGVLSNSGETVRLLNAGGSVADEVTYSSAFPWADSANALGAADDFTLLNSASYQYKGRSLERASVLAGGNDPANWLASPIGGTPTPGAANHVIAAVPKPVAVAANAAQATDDSPVIRASTQIRLNCFFSSTAGLSNVQAEYFVDNVNSFSETRSTVAMTDQGGGQFTCTIPGQADRSVVRYRVLADRGTGLEQAAPRTDAALIVPVSFTGRETWFSCFVTPVRAASPNANYELFVSDDGQPTVDTAGANNYPWNGLNGLQNMAYNATGNPKRATTSTTAGMPREVPFVPATDRLWTGSIPAIFVENGQVRDIHFRFHGSRYNRRPSRPTYKLRFADTQRYKEADSLFVTDKSDYFSVMHGMYVNFHLPISEVRWIDWYMNGNARVTKLEQGEYNGDLLEKFHDREARLNPGAPVEEKGEFFKNVGIIASLGEEGPYTTGDGRPITAAGAWTALQRYEWTYALQNHQWKGPKPFQDFLEGMWAARGDTVAAPNPNIPALRAYFDSVLDVPTELDSMALLNWACPWDDTSQNHFFWKRASGKWAHFPWDFDGFFGNGDTTGTNSWIFLGENGTPSPATNTLGTILGNNFRGPNYFKDSFLKAYRTEYMDRLWVLNNTYLHPENLKLLTFINGAGTAQSYYSYINAVKATFCETRFQSVNLQCGHLADGSDFLRPNKPVHASPLAGASALPPATLTTAAYTHSSGNTTGGNAHAKTKWEIRSNSGGYLEPVFTLTSTTSLTSLPVPFEKLNFGDTYFWRVTFYDATDHPSLVSTETSFVFGPLPTVTTVMAFGDTWKYSSTLAPTDNTWAAPAFNDTAWSSGPGTLAFENQASIAETIRTTLTAPSNLTPAGRAYYFRRKFDFPGTPGAATVRIRHMIDDGCVIYINGTRIARYYMNDAATYAAGAFSNGGPGDAVYAFADTQGAVPAAAWTYVDPRPYLVQGENTIAVEVHQTGATSSDITMGLEMTASLPAIAGDVAINEVMANNRSAVVNGGKNPDWIELKNTTAAAINIGGNGLTDDLLVPNRYVFPANTIIPAGGYLVVWCDSDTLAPGLHTGFGLSSGGQRVVLTNGGALRDYVTFGLQPRDLTIGRITDGTGAFTLTSPTPGAANTALAATGSTATLKVNEWMAKPAHGDDWFELYNPDAAPVALAGLWLSDAPSTPKVTQIPPLSFIAGKGYAEFVADGTNSGNNSCNFQLAAGGDWIILASTSGASTINAVQFAKQTEEISEGRFPDGAAAFSVFPFSRSKADPNWLPAPVVINEALSNSTPPLVDTIELHNPTASAVDLSGWWLSDDKTAPQKYRFPNGTTLAAGGFLVVNETQFNPAPGSPTSFSLNSTGDEIVLTATAGFGGAATGYRAEVGFGAAADGVSFGRVLTGGDPEFWPQTATTFGAVNSAPVVTPVIINEVMYHPADLAGGLDNTRDEFIELHNPTTAPVSLDGWKLKGDADFLFPAGTSLRPGDYVLVVGFNPVTDTAALAAFRAAYGLTAATRLYGPFTPALANDTQDIELARPGTPVLGVTPFINVDKVASADFKPWPLAADGTGPSLQRVSRTIIGNDPANWIAATATPGAVNSTQTPILDNDGDGIPNSAELALGLDPFNSADAALDADSDGQTNLTEYLAGTDPASGSSFLVPASVHPVAGGLQIQFTRQPGKSYSIYSTTDLTPAATWQKIQDVPAVSVATPYTYTEPAPASRRFYKVVPVP